jgi:hypothetical protein
MLIAEIQFYRNGKIRNAGFRSREKNYSGFPDKLISLKENPYLRVSRQYILKDLMVYLMPFKDIFNKLH